MIQNGTLPRPLPRSRLRIAVIGAGVMGRYHAQIYAGLPGAELVAVVDPDPARRADVASACGCAAFATLDDLLNAGPIDAASVAAPTSLHFDVTRRLLEAGVHVLVEKPVATEVTQARRLATLSRERGLVLQVGHITRFYRAVQHLNEVVREPYLIEARRLTPHARIRDVGVILDLMIHDIDIVLRVVDSPVLEATVAGHVLNGGPYEDVAAAQIRFASGCIARFLASRVAPDAERSLVIAEPLRTVRIDFAKEPHTEFAVYTPVRGESGHVRVDRRSVQEDNPLRQELEHFLARIRSDAPPIGTLEDDLRSLALATELVRRLEPRRAALV